MDLDIMNLDQIPRTTKSRVETKEGGMDRIQSTEKESVLTRNMADTFETKGCRGKIPS